MEAARIIFPEVEVVPTRANPLLPLMTPLNNTFPAAELVMVKAVPLALLFSMAEFTVTPKPLEEPKLNLALVPMLTRIGAVAAIVPPLNKIEFV